VFLQPFTQSLNWLDEQLFKKTPLVRIGVMTKNTLMSKVARYFLGDYPSADEDTSDEK